MYRSAVFLVLCTVFWTSIGQLFPQQFVQNPCTSKLTCHDCIRTPSCAWCYDTNVNTTKRCFQQSSPHTSLLEQCDPLQIYNPDNEIRKVLDHDLTLRSGGSASGSFSVEGAAEGYGQGHSEGFGQGSGSMKGHSESSIVQIKPQRVSLMLRAKESYRMSMTYARAEHYPVDLYYLMDLSKSMEDDKEKLSTLGDDLAQTMKRMTPKFTLGFGSFVDKVVMPYVSVIPQNLVSPCPGCTAPYGFRNMMRLSTDTSRFSEMVKAASVSGNLDAPEGGFDAIMQAVVCRGQIGWREKARRLLVFSTDASFHYAGDGKLGGIVKPNDGECHLDQRGYYTMSSKQDYPSISQINTYVKKNAINVIFAVTADRVEIYKQLSTHIEGSTCGQLSNDSSNVVELIKEQYNAISSTVEMKHNASSDVKIRFFSKCLNTDGELIETNKCGNVKYNTSVEFIVELQILQCPKNPRDWNQTIQIYPVGINESLIIDLTMLCDCPCERAGYKTYQKNSTKCGSAGTFMCGVCDCNENAYGPHCECKAGGVANISTANCINKQNGLECSGKGHCVCGECLCDVRPNREEIISGTLCECDNFSCERRNGQFCGGPAFGECICGVCTCHKGWTGSSCGCEDAPEKCIAKTTPMNNATEVNVTCSGRGVCDCGACKCEKPYYGKFCESGGNVTDHCNQYKACVQCRQYKTGKYKTEKECESNPECNFHIVEKDEIIVNDTNNEILCAFYEDDCRFAFVYYYNETGQIEVRAQKELECPPVVFLLGVILGVIAVVVLMGLAILLLWKLLTTIHDRREFARFEKEAMMARWDTGENPIYKQATSTFKNPTYAGKS